MWIIIHGKVGRWITIYGRYRLRGSHYAEDFAAGPMLDLLAACPGGVEAAAKGWGSTNWQSCPLHEALDISEGVDASFKDVDRIIEDKALRLAARMFVPLHDAGKLSLAKRK